MQIKLVVQTCTSCWLHQAQGDPFVQQNLHDANLRRLARVPPGVNHILPESGILRSATFYQIYQTYPSITKPQFHELLDVT